MKFVVVGLSILSFVMLAVVIIIVMPGSPLAANEAPQGYEMGFIDGCIGGIALQYPVGQRPEYTKAWDDCQKLFGLVEDEDRPLVKPPEIQKSHLEELEEQGIEVFHAVWRS